MFEKTNKKGTNGITLIALVITIIVLLILAGVTIAQLTGSDSAPAKANEAKQKNDIGSMKDEISIFAQNKQMEAYENVYVGNAATAGSAKATVGKYVIDKVYDEYNGKTKFGVTAKISKNGAADADIELTTTDWKQTGTIEYEGGVLTWGSLVATSVSEGGQGENDNPDVPDTYTGNLSSDERTALANNGMEELTGSAITNSNLVNNDNIRAVLSGQVPVPNGYTYVTGTSTALGSTPTSWGVVVKDSNQNEWVWVPVNSNESVAPSTIYTTDAEGYPMASYKDQYPASSSSSSSSIDVKSTRRSASYIISNVERGKFYREPALVTDYDLEEINYSEAGFESAEAMAQAFSDDYNAMIESITKYGGFYVGRYELSGTNYVSDGEITNAKVQAGQAPMDRVNWYRLYQACRNFNTETTTSTMIWGSQWDLVCLWTENYSGLKYNEYHSTAHSESYDATTGSNTKDIRNNVYDLEGSRYEWTQEASDTYYRAFRGGDYYGCDSADYRGDYYPNFDDLYSLGSRATLYIM